MNVQTISEKVSENFVRSPISDEIKVYRSHDFKCNLEQTQNKKKSTSKPLNHDVVSLKSDLQCNLDSKKSKSTAYLYFTVIIANLISLAVGISLTWSSPVISKLNGDVETKDNPLGRLISKEEASWIGSILSLGAATGPYVAGYLSDRIGKKTTLIICAGLPNVVAYLILAFAKDIAFYYGARFLNGFALGNVFCILPNYISEISEPSNRGSLSSIMNVFLTIGLFISYSVGPYISIKHFNLMCSLFSVLFVVLFSFLPETPYYLMQSERHSEAEKALTKFRVESKENISKELDKIKDAVEASILKRGTFVDIMRSRTSIKALILSCGLVMFHQLSGINVVLFYTQTIFKATGSTLSPALSCMIIGGAQLLASICTPLLADTAGRRITLLISTIFLILSQAPLGYYFYLEEHGSDVSAIFFLPVACLIIYIIAFRIGLGPLPWTVMAELFPPHVKLAGSTATTSFCYVVAFITTRYFQDITQLVGMSGGFWIFTLCCVAAALFIYFYLPETKKKTFSEINEILHNRR